MKENWIESCQKCLLVKSYEWHKKSFMRLFNQKKFWRGVSENFFFLNFIMASKTIFEVGLSPSEKKLFLFALMRAL